MMNQPHIGSESNNGASHNQVQQRKPCSARDSRRMKIVYLSQRSRSEGQHHSPCEHLRPRELHNFHPSAVSGGAWLSLLYLIVAGSIVGFTAYVWLIHHESPTKVGTYAYVNPVVAVIVGYFLGGETVGPRTLLGTLLVLVSVIVITTTPAKKPTAQPLAKPLQELEERSFR